MRKHTLILAGIAAIMLCITSCLKVEEKNYTYSKALYSDADSLRATEIQKIILTNPYFSEVSTYFGTYSDTYLKAQNDFIAQVGTINDTLIIDQLKANEYATLALISDTQQEICVYKTWTKGAEEE